MTPIQQLIQILQASIAPVTLISGVGLLLLSFTNRFNHQLDRIRLLHKEAKSTSNAEEKKLQLYQIEIIFMRASWIRSAILGAAASIFFVGVVIISVFISQITEFDLRVPAISSITLCLISLMIAMIYFIKDVAYSLRAIKADVETDLKS